MSYADVMSKLGAPIPQAPVAPLVQIPTKLTPVMTPKSESTTISGPGYSKTTAKTFQTPEELKKSQLELKKLETENSKLAKESGKIPAAQLGYSVMAKASLADYAQIKDALKNGVLSYDDIRLAYAKAPTDLTSMFNTMLEGGADSWLRIQTGAQANPSEIQKEKDKYQPRPWDTDKVIDFKLKSLFESRLGRYASSLDENAGVSSTKTTNKTVATEKQVTADDILSKYGVK